MSVSKWSLSAAFNGGKCFYFNIYTEYFQIISSPDLLCACIFSYQWDTLVSMFCILGFHVCLYNTLYVTNDTTIFLVQNLTSLMFSFCSLESNQNCKSQYSPSCFFVFSVSGPFLNLYLLNSIHSFRPVSNIIFWFQHGNSLVNFVFELLNLCGFHQEPANIFYEGLDSVWSKPMAIYHLL